MSNAHAALDRLGRIAMFFTDWAIAVEQQYADCGIEMPDDEPLKVQKACDELAGLIQKMAGRISFHAHFKDQAVIDMLAALPLPTFPMEGNHE